MSWIKENKFLAGFAAATAVGAGALGFMLIQAKGQYEEATTAFEQESSELNRLQHAQPYPNAENVKKLDEQRKQHREAIAQLQKELAGSHFATKQLSPGQFQDQLRQSVDAITKRANDEGMKIAAEHFALGFDRYLSEPPRPEAATALGHQLQAIEFAVGKLIDSHVTELREFKREELPEERGGGGKEEQSGGKGGKSTKEPFKKSAFEMTIAAEQGNFLPVLNSLVTSKQQFFIPRLVTVRNEKDKGPLRVDPAAAAAAQAAQFAQPVPGAGAPAIPGTAPAGTPAPGVPGQPPAPQGGAQFIVGEERIEAYLRVEIVDFADASAATASK